MRKTVNQVNSRKAIGRRTSISDYSEMISNSQSDESIDKIFHDIHGCISIIIGYTQIMLDGVNGKINAEQRQALQDILDCSNHLYELTDSIPKYLEVNSGKK